MVFQRNKSDEQHRLYVEVLDDGDQDKTPLAFAYIPLNQIPTTPGQALRGSFPLYTASRQKKGTLCLTLVVFPTDQDVPHVSTTPEVLGKSELDADHYEHLKYRETEEETTGGAAEAAAGIGLGAGIKALMDGHLGKREV